jgi:poly(A) polymerase
LPEGIDEADGEPDVEEAAAESEPDSEPESLDRVHDDRGRLLRDNVYGTIDQDVWRRDFTCNALYYNIEDFSIWDYVGGVEDIRARTIRLIGDPETRYREDPVRMLRAVRFEAKLGFTIHETARTPFATLAELLGHIPPARLLDEFLKLFLAGFGQRSFELLRTHGLFEHLFPATAAHLASEPNGMSLALIRSGLANTDRRVAEGRPVTPMFLFAVLLFGPVSAAAQRRFESGMHPGMAIADAVDEIVSGQNRRIGIPKRFSIPMRELLSLQPRFHRREGRRALAFLTHPRFRAAYDFLLLRAEAGAEDPAIAAWWTEIQTLNPDQQRERAGEDSGGGHGAGPARRRRRRRGGRNRTPSAET